MSESGCRPIHENTQDHGAIRAGSITMVILLLIRQASPIERQLANRTRGRYCANCQQCLAESIMRGEYASGCLAMAITRRLAELAQGVDGDPSMSSQFALENTGRCTRLAQATHDQRGLGEVLFGGI